MAETNSKHAQDNDEEYDGQPPAPNVGIATTDDDDDDDDNNNDYNDDDNDDDDDIDENQYHTAEMDVTADDDDDDVDDVMDSSKNSPTQYDDTPVDDEDDEDEDEDNVDDDEDDDDDENRGVDDNTEMSSPIMVANSEVSSNDVSNGNIKTIPLKRGRGRGPRGRTSNTTQTRGASRTPSVSGLTIPFRTIKKSMKLDPDIPIVQNEAAIMTTVAVELFLKRLVSQSYRNAKNRGRNTVRYEDVAEARTSDKALAFLEPLLP